MCLYHVLFVCSIPILHSHSSGIIEEGGSREHSFGVITPERTYHLTAESETDKRYRHPHTLSHFTSLHSHPSTSHTHTHTRHTHTRHPHIPHLTLTPLTLISFISHLSTPHTLSHLSTPLTLTSLTLTFLTLVPSYSLSCILLLTLPHTHTLIPHTPTLTPTSLTPPFQGVV